MSNEYDPNSCNAYEKPYYYPIEVAIRWCNLVVHEKIIMDKMGAEIVPPIGMFPQWPCLRSNTERIFDAVINSELRHGRDGKTVDLDDHVAPHRVTVRHADLREWMQKRYPDQKPRFLFDETERGVHSAINADSFRALQADRDALKARIQKAEEVYRVLKSERDSLSDENLELKKAVEDGASPDERSKLTYLNIIAGMLDLMLGETPAGKPQSVYQSQAAIIDGLIAYHPQKPGISKRTLEEKFAEAKRSISS